MSHKIEVFTVRKHTGETVLTIQVYPEGQAACSVEYDLVQLGHLIRLLQKQRRVLLSRQGTQEINGGFHD